MFNTGDEFRSESARAGLPEPTMARLGDMRRAPVSREVPS